MAKEKGVYLIEIIETYYMGVKKSKYEAYADLATANLRFCELCAMDNFGNVENLRLHTVSIKKTEDE
jgi:hypothetical protein